MNVCTCDGRGSAPARAGAARTGRAGRAGPGGAGGIRDFERGDVHVQRTFVRGCAGGEGPRTWRGRGGRRRRGGRRSRATSGSPRPRPTPAAAAAAARAAACARRAPRRRVGSCQRPRGPPTAGTSPARGGGGVGRGAPGAVFGQCLTVKVRGWTSGSEAGGAEMMKSMWAGAGKDCPRESRLRYDTCHIRFCGGGGARREVRGRGRGAGTGELLTGVTKPLSQAPGPLPQVPGPFGGRGGA